MNAEGPDKSEFERQGEQRPHSLAKEFWLFLKENKKWWLLPILLILGLLALLAFLTATGAAPFIYPLI